MMEKEALWKGLKLFLGAMVLFTLLSRAVYQQGRAVVSTAAPTSGTVEHTVRVTGKTVQEQEAAVVTQPGLLVGAVRVSEGQQVQAGDVLFCLDLDNLEEAITAQSRELRKQRLSVQESYSQNSAQARRQSLARAQAQENYDTAVSGAEAALERAEQAVAKAQGALDALPPGEIPEQSLLDAADQAQRNFEQALDDLDNAQRIYGQALETANLPEAVSNGGRIGQITYDQLEEKLQKLEAIRDAQGQVLAPADGVVTACYVRTGQLTGDTAAVLIADSSQGWKFTATVTQEQSQYIGTGDKVTLVLESTGKEYRDLPVTAFSPQEDGGTLTVSVPAQGIPLGAGMELRFTKRSQAYNCCVPLTALHMDAQNRPYVLTVETVNTVLGAQTQAVKTAVTVLDQNDKMAALEGGGLTDRQVIVSADRAVDDGSRVRAE